MLASLLPALRMLLALQRLVQLAQRLLVQRLSVGQVRPLLRLPALQGLRCLSARLVALLELVHHLVDPELVQVA